MDCLSPNKEDKTELVDIFSAAENNLSPSSGRGRHRFRNIVRPESKEISDNEIPTNNNNKNNNNNNNNNNTNNFPDINNKNRDNGKDTIDRNKGGKAGYDNVVTFDEPFIFPEDDTRFSDNEVTFAIRRERASIDIEQIIENNTTVPNPRDRPRSSVGFRDLFMDTDGNKRIDFVLVHTSGMMKEKLKLMRKDYKDNLQDFGLEIEESEREEGSKIVYYTKIHCPFSVLTKGAQLIKLTKPLKMLSNPSTLTISENFDCWSCCRPKEPKSFPLYQPFIDQNRFKFDIENEDTYFTSAERNYITFSLLERNQFQHEGEVHTGLGCMLGNGAYGEAFPLHEKLNVTNSVSIDQQEFLTDREKLYQNWVKAKNIFKTQPLESIRRYFGEQFTLYFAWLGVYTVFLIPASIFGLGCFIYGLCTFYNYDTPINDICDPTRSPGNYTICPKCDLRCDYEKLTTSCNYARFARVFDNNSTLACAVFMTVWAICFVEIWKRKQLLIQYQWNVNDFEADENVRPEFFYQASKFKKNPVTGTEEPHVTTSSRVARVLLSICTIFFLCAVVIAIIISILIYRMAVAYSLYQVSEGTIKKNVNLITTITAAVLNVIAISILGFIYQKVAKFLTNLEAHKTKTSYEESLITKIVIFQAINNYGSIAYIAFFKGSFIDKPGMISYYVGKYRADQCNESGCFSELTLQMIIIMIGKQVINAFLELTIPLVKRCVKSWSSKKHPEVLTQWQKDNTLVNQYQVSMLDEYLEMVIQYGFVVLFVAAFPLAPFFALLNNLIEIRLDAYKMVCLFKRPVAMKAQDIGAWEYSIVLISYLAVITNAFIIAWTSDFIPKSVYKYTIDNSLGGYVKWSLSPFNTSDFVLGQAPDVETFPESQNVAVCWYRFFLTPAEQVENRLSDVYWKILTARWAFVIVFEHLCILFMSLMKLIPDTTQAVRLIQKYEKLVKDNQEVDHLFDKVKVKRKTIVKDFHGLLPVNFENAIQPY